MATRSPLPVRGPLERRTIVVGVTAGFAITIFAASELSSRGGGGITLLYVIPVVLLALELGLGAAVSAAGLSLGLIAIAALTANFHASTLSVLAGGAALLGVAAIAGRFSDRMRHGRTHHYDLLRSGLALAEMSDAAVLPMLVAQSAFDLVPALGARVAIDGLPIAQLGQLADERLEINLRTPDALFGTLELSPQRSRPFSADQRLALDQLTVQASVAVKNQRLLAETRKQDALAAELDHARKLTAEHAHRVGLVLASQETERREVAHELHEQVAQALTAIHLGLAAVERDADSTATRPQLEALRSHLADTLRGLRELAVGLRPPTLDQLGLVPALQGLAERAGARSGREIVLEVDGLSQRLPPALETTVYRVVDEMLGVLAGPASIRVSRDETQNELQIVATPFVGGGGDRPLVDDLARIRARLELTDGTLDLLEGAPKMLEARIPVGR